MVDTRSEERVALVTGDVRRLTRCVIVDTTNPMTGAGARGDHRETCVNGGSAGDGSSGMDP
jgi:hypothetical protein